MSTDKESEEDRYKAFGTMEDANFNALLFQRRGERGADEVRGGVAKGRGGRNHGLARLLGAAVLGEDPDPPANQGPPPAELGVPIRSWPRSLIGARRSSCWR